MKALGESHVQEASARGETSMSPDSADDWRRRFTDAAAVVAARLVAAEPGRVHPLAIHLFERGLFAYVLRVTGGNQVQAARLLGLNRNTLRKRCRALKLEAGRESVTVDVSVTDGATRYPDVAARRQGPASS